MQRFHIGLLLIFACFLPLFFIGCSRPEIAEMENGLQIFAGEHASELEPHREKANPIRIEHPLFLSTGQGKVEKTLSFSRNREELSYSFPNGDIFLQQRLYDGGTPEKWIIDSQSCSLRYYDDEKKQWVILSEPQSFQSREMLFLSFDSRDIILSPPFAYKAIERSCLQELPEMHGAINLKQLEKGKWELSLSWPEGKLGKDAVRHWWVLTSENPLIDWKNPVMKEIWPGYRFTEDMRWCWDGMYQQTPDSYKPGGKGIFFLNPASYIPCRFVLTGGSRAADDLAIAMLDLIRQNYTEQGYIPVSTGSLWLEKEYGIGASYFDTRWNTDLAEAYLLAGEKFAVREFTHTALRYANYLCTHIESHGFHLPGMEQGLLVFDYGWDAAFTENHCSLNHQLAEILFLYHTGVSHYADVADLLLLGIEETVPSWLKENGDLQYGMQAAGSYIGQDYPDLTYYDLMKLQEYLEKSRGERSKALDELMLSKAAWMEKQGIPTKSK